MPISDTKTKIVHPFGLVGGPYKVSMAGVWMNRLNWFVAIAVIGLSLFRKQLDVSEWVANWALGIGALICLSLSIIVARKGRRV
jgi:hypothetical protein